MIEKIVIKYLKEKLDVPVYMGEKPPTNKSKEYVLIKTIDGGRVNMIDASTLTLTSYSDSLLNAAELNSKVKDAMYNIVELDEVSASKCGGGGQSIKTQTKEDAYECIFNLWY